MSSKYFRWPMFLGLLWSASPAIGQAEAQSPSLPNTANLPEGREDEPKFASVRFLTGERNGTDYWPSFSPDGKRIIFSRRSGPNQPYRLYVVSLEVGTPKPFPAFPLRVGATRANWSWRRDEIAFTGRANSKNQVWLIQGDGTHPHPLALADLTAGVAYPSWDREGQQLVVVDYQNDQGGILKRIDIAQQRVTALTQFQEVLAGMPAVSPDGKTIAFAGQLNKGVGYDQRLNSIFLLKEHQELQQISAGQGRAPSWSPDGHWITFESNRADPKGKHALYIVSPEGKHLKKLTSNVLDANHPVWSPDGKNLAFSALNPQTQTASIATVQIEPE